MIHKYNFEEHCHRYACWTAARAASVSRFSNREIAELISGISLRDSTKQLSGLTNISYRIYKEWFSKKTKELLMLMKKMKVRNEKSRNVSFGIAAKVISIYIKTVEVIPSQGKSALSKYAFPPIDRVLLNKLKKDESLKITNANWSKFNSTQYLKIIEKLWKYNKNKPFWDLEINWNLEESN